MQRSRRTGTADRGGGNNAADSPQKSPTIIGRAMAKSKKTEKDQESTDKLSTDVDAEKSDSKGGTDTLSTPVNNGKFSTTQLSPPSSAISKHSTSSAAEYENFTDEAQVDTRLVTVYSLYESTLKSQDYVPFMVSFENGQIKDICIDFPPTEEFGDAEAEQYYINTLHNFNADDGYFPLVCLQMMCLVDDLPRHYMPRIDETFPVCEYPQGTSRFSGHIAEMLITGQQNCDSGRHPSMARSVSPAEPATQAQMEELGIMYRGYHAVVHNILLTTGSNEKKNAQDRNDSVNREAAHNLETLRNEIDTKLVNKLDPNKPFFKDDQQKNGSNIIDEQVRKLGDELDSAHKFNGTQLPAHSIAYFTPGYLAYKLGTGTTTLNQVYSPNTNSSSELHKPSRTGSGKRRGWGTLNDEKSIPSHQFSSDKPSSSLIESLQNQTHFNRFCVIYRSPTTPMQDKNVDTQGLNPAVAGYSVQIQIDFLKQLKHNAAELPAVDTEVAILTRIAKYDHLIFEQLKHLVYDKLWGNNTTMSPALTRLRAMVLKFNNRDLGTSGGLAGSLVGARPNHLTDPFTAWLIATQISTEVRQSIAMSSTFLALVSHCLTSREPAALVNGNELSSVTLRASTFDFENITPMAYIQRLRGYVTETQKRLTNMPGLGVHPHFQDTCLDSWIIYTTIVEIMRSRCRSQETTYQSLSSGYKQKALDAYQCTVNRASAYRAKQAGNLKDLDLDEVTHKTHIDNPDFRLEHYAASLAPINLIDVFDNNMANFTAMLDHYLKELSPPDKQKGKKPRASTVPSTEDISASLSAATSNSLAFFNSSSGKGNAAPSNTRGEDKEKPRKQIKGSPGTSGISSDMPAAKAELMQQFVDASKELYNIGKKLTPITSKGNSPFSWYSHWGIMVAKSNENEQRNNEDIKKFFNV